MHVLPEVSVCESSVQSVCPLPRLCLSNSILSCKSQLGQYLHFEILLGPASICQSWLSSLCASPGMHAHLYRITWSAVGQEAGTASQWATPIWLESYFFFNVLLSLLSSVFVSFSPLSTYCLYTQTHDCLNYFSLN